MGAVEERGKLEFANNYVSTLAVATGTTVSPAIPGVAPVSASYPIPVTDIVTSGGTKILLPDGRLVDYTSPLPIAVISGGTQVGASSGENIYTNVPNNLHFIATPSSGTQSIVISAIGFTPDAGCISLASNVKRYVSGSTFVFDYIPVTNVGVVDNGDNTYTVTFADMSGTFNADDGIAMTMYGPVRAEDDNLDSKKVIVQNPLTPGPVETVLSSADIGTGTTRYIVTMDDYHYFNTQLEMSTNSTGDSITVTVLGTLNDDAAASADTDWIDISSEALGATGITVSGTGSSSADIYAVDSKLGLLKIAYKVVGVGANENMPVLILNRRFY